jgi:predicted Zn-dependent protease with MMP-like domain
MTRPRLSMKKFCAMAGEVLDGLPEPFHAWLENVVVDVELAPSSEMLEALGMQADDVLMGLFEGSAVTEQEYGEHAPNRILLFKDEIESQCDSVAEVAYEIRRTMIHELAHHFGYSEEDLQAFESLPSPFDDSADKA